MGELGRNGLIISEKFGARIHLNDAIMTDLLAKSLETSAIDEKGWRDVGTGPGSTDGGYIRWLTIKDQPASVLEDVQRIRKHPLVPGSIPIYGYIYDVHSGRLERP